MLSQDELLKLNQDPSPTQFFSHSTSATGSNTGPRYNSSSGLSSQVTESESEMQERLLRERLLREQLEELRARTPRQLEEARVASIAREQVSEQARLEITRAAEAYEA